MREHVFCVLNISNGNGCMDDRSTIALLLVGHDSLEHADNQFIVYRDDGLMGERDRAQRAECSLKRSPLSSSRKWQENLQEMLTQ